MKRLFFILIALITLLGKVNAQTVGTEVISIQGGENNVSVDRDGTLSKLQVYEDPGTKKVYVWIKFTIMINGQAWQPNLETTRIHRGIGFIVDEQNQGELLDSYDYFDRSPFGNVPGHNGFERTLELIVDNPSYVSVSDVIELPNRDALNTLFGSTLSYQVDDVNKNGKTNHGVTLLVSISSGGVVTAVDDVNSATVSSVKYYNLAGMSSDVPFDGVNIKVEKLTNGTVKQSKFVK